MTRRSFPSPPHRAAAGKPGRLPLTTPAKTTRSSGPTSTAAPSTTAHPGRRPALLPLHRDEGGALREKTATSSSWSPAARHRRDVHPGLLLLPAGGRAEPPFAPHGCPAGHAEIMRPAYAIEYDCIDPTELLRRWSEKSTPLLRAGQFNAPRAMRRPRFRALLPGSTPP